ncbi:HlyD family secretion protein [Bradyrhizobium sp. WSM 1704]|uniref:HlyD family secretion protein n=1 Tax=Bradyrhizobium semiaridum TaxID=2821404 RepID=UPI001CE31F4A|nr:HlyD family secretion protein [Bradyrhizobium semiaridum]MCA6126009.1 HlyD family secretion protein [Bradyrhizobium semiaridum]
MFDDSVLERDHAKRDSIEGSLSVPVSHKPGVKPDRPETARAPTQERPVGREPAGPDVAVPVTAGAAPRSSFLRRRPVISAVGAVLLAATLVSGYLYMDYTDHFESTDDAFIAARQSTLAPKVAGYIVAVPITDNQHVNAGDVIARLDDRDYRVALTQAEAQVAAAQASIQNADAQLDVQRAQIDANQAQVDQAQAALVFAQQQAARFQHLEQTGYGTVQNSEQYTSQLHQQQAALLSAKATLNLAQRQIEALTAQRKSAVANLAQMQAQRDQAELNLSYTTVRAAQPGRVVNLTAAVGQFAQAGTNLSMFVPDQTWVTANFKEIQLNRMRPGEKVTLRIDAYPNRTIQGHVESVQPGSGTAFSLLPAQNATGNYVKIVQRVPVKIVMDNPPTDVALGPGMSVMPTVRVDASPSLLERLGSML